MIEGATGPWETVIGLEVHAQVVSKAKLFSGAATQFGAEPNTQVSPVDAAFPGMLPVINRFCVEQAVKTGLALDAEIRLESVFDRKNYFYPDLPPGYQISQYQQPVVGRGKVVLDMPDGTTREIGITRLHLEQDAGKSLHDQHPILSYVDLNRAGIALMEIVSEPDLRSAEEAGIYLRKLRSILRYLGIFIAAAGNGFDWRRGSIGNFILSGALLAEDGDIRYQCSDPGFPRALRHIRQCLAGIEGQWPGAWRRAQGRAVYRGPASDHRHE